MPHSKVRHKIKVTEEILKEEKARQDGPLLGNSNAVKKLRREIEAASSSNDNILLYSDSGCGEENIARTIHKRSSMQREQRIVMRFIPVMVFYRKIVTLRVPVLMPQLLLLDLALVL